MIYNITLESDWKLENEITYKYFTVPVLLMQIFIIVFEISI